MHKADAELIADRAISGALKHADLRSGAIVLPGPASVWGARSDGYEATARLAVLAAARLAGTEVDGQPTPAWLDRIVSLIKVGAGARTGWPTPAESAQAIVEDANLAKALLIGGDALWDALGAGTQEQLVDRFELDLARAPATDNWALYPATSAAFLESRGQKSDATARAIEYANARADDWYLGDGWYADGTGNRPDYYSAWSFHYELVMIAWKTGDTERLKVLTERLRALCESLRGLIGDKGAPVYWGRSLTYRFALASPLAWLAVIDPATPNAATLGSTWSSVVEHFLGATPQAAEIAIPGEILPLGWIGEDRAIAQRYSGPGSAYWAFRSFIALLLPSAHPFWVPATSPPKPRTLVLDPGLIARSSGAVAVLHNHSASEPRATRRDDPLYARRSYSSHTSPATVAGYADNSLSIRNGSRIVADNRGVVTAGRVDPINRSATSHSALYRTRKLLAPRILNTGRLQHRLGSRVTATGITVVEATVSTSDFDVHLYFVDGPLAGAARVDLTGWPVWAEDRGAVTTRMTGEVESEVFTNSVYAHLVGLHGFTSHRTVTGAGHSPFGKFATMTVLHGHPGQAGVFIAASRLATARPASVERPTAEVDGRHVLVRTATSEVVVDL